MVQGIKAVLQELGGAKGEWDRTVVKGCFYDHQKILCEMASGNSAVSTYVILSILQRSPWVTSLIRDAVFKFSFH